MNVAMSDSKQQTQFELVYGSRRSRYVGRLDWITFSLSNFALRHSVFLGGEYRLFGEALYIHLQGEDSSLIETCNGIYVKYIANSPCNMPCGAEWTAAVFYTLLHLSLEGVDDQRKVPATLRPWRTPVTI